MKIFLSYRFSGEDLKELEKILSTIKQTLEEKGHYVFCSFWKEDYFQKNNFTNKQILFHEFPEVEESDIILAFVKSKEKSEGMLLEIGYGLAHGKRLFLLVKKDVSTTFLHSTAEKVIEFESADELATILKNASF